jgi:dienelactone hydrolase
MEFHMHSHPLDLRPWICVLLTIVCTPTFADTPAALPAPELRGPFPVGVTTRLLIDHSRTDEATKCPRSTMTEIWYPATEDTKGLPSNDMMEFFAKGTNPIITAVVKQAFNSNLNEVRKTFQNFSVRDARIRNGKYPLVLFSHGNGGMRCQNVFWCEHLASHGYIVMSPDHTGNACITTIDGVAIPYNVSGRKQAAKDRPKDIIFLIDAMDRMNKGGDSRFFAKVEMDRIAVGGHSFGGYTSIAVAAQDERIKAIVSMAGVTSDDASYTCPSMILVATEDDTIGLKGNEAMRAFYSEIKAPKYLVEFKNAGHYSFSEMYQFNPTFGDGVGQGKRITDGSAITYIDMDTAYRLLNGYTTAFLGKFLRGQDGYDAYLSANHNMDELILKSAPAQN